MCLQEGLSPQSVLLQFRDAGVTTVALSETTLEKLRDAGELTFIQPVDFFLYSAAKQFPPFPYPSLMVIVKDKALKPWLNSVFSALLGPSRFKEFSDGFLLRGEKDELTQMGLGVFPPQAVELAAMGFLVDPRLENRNVPGSPELTYLVGNMVSLPNVSTAIFTGSRNEVLGFDSQVSDVAKFLRARHVRFGYVEAYDKSHVQKGAEAFAETIPDDVVKVQGLVVPPLTRFDPDKALDVFLLGVHERNVRDIYFRPFLMSFNGKTVLQENLDFLQELQSQLIKSGYQLGKVTPYPLAAPSLPWVLAALAGVAAAAFLLAGLFFKVPAIWFWLVYAAGFGVTGALFHTHWNFIWLSVLALIAAILMPTFGLVWFSPEGPLGFSRSVRNLCFATLMTIGGGFFLSVFLSNNLTLLGIDGFRGVKAVLAVPTVLAPWLAWLYRNPGARSRDFLQRPVKVYHVIAILALAAVGLFMILRSGNTFSESAALPFEKTVRIFLESALTARPRFKELIGHPFFLLASWLGLANGIGVFSFVLGSLGQADIMDSFAHLHTPIGVTLLRTFNGLWLGILIGWVFQGVMRFRRARPDNFRIRP